MDGWLDGNGKGVVLCLDGLLIACLTYGWEEGDTEKEDGRKEGLKKEDRRKEN